MRNFAAQIFTALGPARSISLTVRNASALDAADNAAIEQNLQAELARLGASTAPLPSTDAALSTAVVTVDVTLSQGVEGYLWVAAVHGPAGDRTVIVPVHVPAAAALDAKPVPALHSVPLLEQSQPILDFVPLTAPDGAPLVLVLTPGNLALLERNGAAWSERAIAEIPHTHPWPRDLRGRLVLSGANALQAFLPGVSCTGTWSGTLAVQCHDDKDANLPWPSDEQTKYALAPGRNYFAAPNAAPHSASAAATAVSAALPIAYSIASISPDPPSSWIVTTPDGTAQLFENGKGPRETFSGWGDNIVSVATGCSAERDILVSGTGDWTQPDRIQAYEITDRQATAVGQPLEFPGPILALWPSEDAKSARVITQNVSTGLYEASIVSVSCGD